MARMRIAHPDRVDNPAWQWRHAGSRLARPPRWWLRYSFGIAAAGLALVATYLLDSRLSQMPAPLLFAAVILTAWYGGLGPALVCTFLCAMGLDIFIGTPLDPRDAGGSSFLYLVVFVLDAGIDEDGDGVLDDDEVIAGFHPTIGPAGVTTVWEVDEEIDATFEELFGVEEDDAEEEDDDSLNNPGVIAIHESEDNYANIVACAEMSGPTDWEDRDTVVLGLTPGEDSNFYGYAVFERDTGNIPVFGDNTTGVTVYLFDDPTTSRDNQSTEATPES